MLLSAPPTLFDQVDSSGIRVIAKLRYRIDWKSALSGFIFLAVITACVTTHLLAQQAGQLPGIAATATTNVPEVPDQPNNVDDPPQDAGQPVLKITYSHGSLGVIAHGCRLVDVLRAIGKQAGVSVELPGGAGQERVFMELAPGPIREVLQSLLDGAEFNYILLWSKAEPQQLASIILSQRTRTVSAPAELIAAAPMKDVAPTKPALYQQTFAVSPDEQATTAPSPQPDPSAMGSASEVAKRAAAEGKTPGEILGEMQKELIQRLDDQAAKAGQH